MASDEVQAFFCQSCNKSFLTLKTLLSHQQSRGHIRQTGVGNLLEYHCRICNAVFTRQSSRKRHQENFHGVVERTDLLPIEIAFIHQGQDHTGQELMMRTIDDGVPGPSRRASETNAKILDDLGIQSAHCATQNSGFENENTPLLRPGKLTTPAPVSQAGADDPSSYVEATNPLSWLNGWSGQAAPHGIHPLETPTAVWCLNNPYLHGVPPPTGTFRTDVDRNAPDYTVRSGAQRFDSVEGLVVHQDGHMNRPTDTAGHSTGSSDGFRRVTTSVAGRNGDWYGEGFGNAVGRLFYGDGSSYGI